MELIEIIKLQQEQIKILMRISSYMHGHADKYRKFKENSQVIASALESRELQDKFFCMETEELGDKVMRCVKQCHICKDKRPK